MSVVSQLTFDKLMAPSGEGFVEGLRRMMTTMAGQSMPAKGKWPVCHADIYRPIHYASLRHLLSADALCFFKVDKVGSLLRHCQSY